MDNRSSVRTVGLVTGTVVLLIVLFLVAGISTGFLPWRETYADNTIGADRLEALSPAPTVPSQGEEGVGVVPDTEPEPDVTLDEEFPTYTITVTFSRGGTAIPYGNNAVVERGEMTVTAVPDEGYSVDEMVIDGVRHEGLETYVFKDVSEDHTVYISFKRNVFNPELVPPVYSEEGEAPLLG